MRYIFYGKHQVTNYNPFIADYYGAKVPTLGAFTKTASVEEFFRKDNVHVEIKEGQWININGENVCISSIQYDIVDDSHKCITNKILSKKDGNMTHEEAEEKLKELTDKGFFKGFLKRFIN